MASVNKIIIVGNLGRDPEVRTFPNGDRVANVTIATTDKWKDKASGEMKEHTEWHRVVFFSRLAEIAGEYLKKGSQAYVEGRLRTRKRQGEASQARYTPKAPGTTPATPRTPSGTCAPRGGSSIGPKRCDPAAP